MLQQFGSFSSYGKEAFFQFIVYANDKAVENDLIELWKAFRNRRHTRLFMCRINFYTVERSKQLFRSSCLFIRPSMENFFWYMGASSGIWGWGENYNTV